MRLRESTINREYRKIWKAQEQVYEEQNVPKKRMPPKKGKRKRKRQHNKKTKLTLKDDLMMNQLFDLSAALKKLSSSHSLLLEEKNRQGHQILSQNQNEKGVFIKPPINSLKRKFCELDSENDSSFDKITSEFKKLKITDIHEPARMQRDSQLLEKVKAIKKDNEFMKDCKDPQAFQKQILRLFQEFETCKPSNLLKPEWMKQKLQYSLEACFDSSELDFLMLQVQLWPNSSNLQLLSSLIFDTIEEL